MFLFLFEVDDEVVTKATLKSKLIKHNFINNKVIEVGGDTDEYSGSY